MIDLEDRILRLANSVIGGEKTGDFLVLLTALVVFVAVIVILRSRSLTRAIRIALAVTIISVIAHGLAWLAVEFAIGCGSDRRTLEPYAYFVYPMWFGIGFVLLWTAVGVSRILPRRRQDWRAGR